MQHADHTIEWDVVVIGGGPAGMMAAGRAAEYGARVLLLEKNTILGKKLLITGGGRCNVTNAELNTKVLLSKYKDAGKFLASPFAAYSVAETLDFFHSHGMETKVEEHQRVFPASDSARSVLDALVSYMREGNVTVRLNTSVTRTHGVNGYIEGVELVSGEVVRARSYIIATGGMSRPDTGSTGDGFDWLRELGHTVVHPEATLVPIAIKEKSLTARAAGVALPEAKISLYQNGTRRAQRFGKILFTHIGLSGPGILNMSRDIGELLKQGPVVIELDLFPSLDYEKLDALLQDALAHNGKKLLRNILGTIVPPALSPVILASASLDGETVSANVTRTMRISLMKILKHFRVEADHLLGSDKAIITAGGVALTEVDWKYMRSTKYPNLYLTGDILDIDRPSGGYSLQLCWTTGYVAGTSAAAKHKA